MRLRNSILILCVSTLAACVGPNTAPVVYGTNPQWQGRVYESPEQLPYASASKNGPSNIQPSAARRGPGSGRAQARAISGGAPLTPVVEGEAPALIQVAANSSASAPGYRQSLVNPRPEIQFDNGRKRRPVNTVRVGKGDTVYAIARRVGVPPKEIIELNNLREPFQLSIGEVLRVPNAFTVNDQFSGTAPVDQVSKPQPSRARTHVVRRGDTLYAISRGSGVSVQALAKANNLRVPYTLSVGEELVVPTAATSAMQARAVVIPARRAQEASYSPTAKSKSASPFEWPVRGRVVQEFQSRGAGGRNDGIDIAAPSGTPVRAAADGEVVYRGSELKGYGNLLLVKHADGYVTAYAHNDSMIVRKGQMVRRGQVIARVGQSGETKEPKLHFEIRKDLKAVNPIALLGA
ncbi:MAG: M23 family metallopeptidase [Parvularculaceae bacterium]|nr:MAG: M23 family metallopeptidase [Parvularculaceae bacterium]